MNKYFLPLLMLFTFGVLQNVNAADCKSDFNFEIDGTTVFFLDDSESETGDIFYFWTFGDGTTSTDASPTHEYTEPGVYEVCLTIETAGGCSDERCELVAIGEVISCTAGFEFLPDGLTCSFEDGSVAAPGDVVEYLWSFGDGGTSTFDNPIHTYASTGTYEVCLQIFTDDGCTDIICQPVVIGGAGGECEANFNFDISDLTVAFSDESLLDAGEVISWSWTFGDGSTSELPNPTHTYDAAGVYNVCLLIITSEGCIADICHTVEVAGGVDCFANFDYEVDGLHYFFNSNTDPGPGDVDSYMWTFGDGGTSDAENPNHIYAEPGIYTVCLVVHFATGCVAEYCNEIIIEGGGGDCMVSAEVIATDGMSKHFFASVTPEADEITYTWFFGDGTMFTETTAGTPSDPWHVYAEPGTYNVCVVAETGAGCVVEYCFEIVVEMPGGGDCEADFEWDADGLTVHFIETADGGGSEIISYFWEFGDGSTSDAMNPFHTYEDEDNYEVCLTIETVDGCIHTFCDEIDVEADGGTCAAGYIVTSTELTPDGWVVHFENTSTAAGDITSTTWYFGDGTITESFDAEHIYTESGTYAVCVVISTADGCTDEYCFELFVGGDGGECEADFEFEKSMLHVAFFENADGGGADIVSYSWNFGDGTTSVGLNPEHTYATPGIYLVCLTIVTSDSCISTKCEEIEVEGEGGDCEAKFDVTSITETGSGWVVVLNNNSTGSEIYHWNFGDGGTSESENPDHLFTTSGIYTICLTIGVEGGDCFDEKCEEVFVGGDECIDATAIDSTYGCLEIYEPVCGCDGITYTNSCHAIYYGGVVFYTDGVCAATTIQEENIFGTVKISPNPAQNSTTITYHLKEQGMVNIEVLDITGKMTSDPISHPSIAGNYTVELNTSELSSGIYVVRISSNGNETMQKLMITK